MKEYVALEDRFLSLIYEKYLGKDVTQKEAALVKQIDNDMLAYDLFYLLGEGHENELPTLNLPITYDVQPFEEVERAYLELFQKAQLNLSIAE